MAITQHHRDFVEALLMLLAAGQEGGDDAAKLLARYTDLLGAEEACSLFNFVVADYHDLVATATKH